MKYTPVLLLGLLLTACATSFDTFDRALPKLKGQNIKVAINYLGIPDQEYEIAGKKVYVWSTTGTNPFPTAITTTTDGTAGNKPFKATSTTYAYDPTPLGCKVKIATDNEIVTNIEYDGNNGPCFKYSDRLKPLLDGAR